MSNYQVLTDDPVFRLVRKIEDLFVRIPPDSFTVIAEEKSGELAGKNMDNSTAFFDAWIAIKNLYCIGEEAELLNRAILQVRDWPDSREETPPISRGEIIGFAYQIKNTGSCCGISPLEIALHKPEVVFIKCFVISFSIMIESSCSPSWEDTENLRKDAVAILTLLEAHGGPVAFPVRFPEATQDMSAKDTEGTQGMTPKDRGEKDEEKPQQSEDPKRP